MHGEWCSSARVIVGAVAVALVALACGGGTGDTSEGGLAERIAALEVAAVETPSPSPQPVATDLPPTGTPTAAPAPSPQAPRPLPTVAATAETVMPPQVRYVSDTGGSGVSHRDDCRETARTGQAGLSEGQRVLREARGIGRCDGWSLVRASGRASWVRTGYLSEAPLQVTPPRIATVAPVHTATAAPPPAACRIEDAAARVVGSTALVVGAEGGRGTAFYVGNGEWVTAAHVVEDVLSVTLRSASVDLRAEVRGLHPTSDIAILGAASDLPALRWGSLPSVGAPVATAGYPRGVGTIASLTRGHVSRLVRFDSDIHIQTDTAMSPGNSGGPLFDACGDVVGVVTSKWVDEAIEGVGFALANPTAEERLAVVRSGPTAEEVGELLVAVFDGWRTANEELDALTAEWNAVAEAARLPSAALETIAARRTVAAQRMFELLRGREGDPALGVPAMRRWWAHALAYWRDETYLGVIMQRRAQATTDVAAFEAARAVTSAAFGSYEDAECAVAEHFELSGWTREDGSPCY